MNKLRELVKANHDDITRMASGSTSTQYDEFRNIVLRMAQSQLTEHEIITIARYYQDRQEDNTTAQQMVAMAQEQLRKANFDDFSAMLEQCIKFDKERCVHSLYRPVLTLLVIYFCI